MSDSFSLLPEELLFQILRILETEELLAMTRVSRAFLGCALSHLYRQVYFAQSAETTDGHLHFRETRSATLCKCEASEEPELGHCGFPTADSNSNQLRECSGTRIVEIERLCRTLGESPRLRTEIRSASFCWISLEETPEDTAVQTILDWVGPSCMELHLFPPNKRTYDELASQRDFELASLLRYPIRTLSVNMPQLLRMGDALVLQRLENGNVHMKTSHRNLRRNPRPRLIKDMENREAVIERKHAVFAIQTLRYLSVSFADFHNTDPLPPWPASHRCSISNVTHLTLHGIDPEGENLNLLYWPRALEFFSIENRSRYSQFPWQEIVDACALHRTTLRSLSLSDNYGFPIVEADAAGFSLRSFHRLQYLSISQDAVWGKHFETMDRAIQCLPPALEELELRVCGSTLHSPSQEIQNWFCELAALKATWLPHLRRVVLWYRIPSDGEPPSAFLNPTISWGNAFKALYAAGIRLEWIFSHNSPFAYNKRGRNEVLRVDLDPERVTSF